MNLMETLTKQVRRIDELAEGGPKVLPDEICNAIAAGQAGVVAEIDDGEQAMHWMRFLLAFSQNLYRAGYNAGRASCDLFPRAPHDD